MKFIISHDIDHYYWSDHFFKDFFIQKYILKNTYFFIRRQISFSLYRARIKAFSSNRFGRLKELVEFNLKHEVPASYFMGVKNALNLSYSLDTAASIASYLNQQNCPLYLHGIEYADLDRMKSEKETFQKIALVSRSAGIRMHYLRNSANTFQFLSKLGYDFDSTLYELRDPFFIENTLEFPVAMMEVYMMPYNEDDFEKIRVRTEERIEHALGSGMKYFTVIFHDHHFSDSFPLHKKWYEWLIQHLKRKRYEFIDFVSAADEIRSTQLKSNEF